jgi:hypothetical protein
MWLGDFYSDEIEPAETLFDLCGVRISRALQRGRRPKIEGNRKGEVRAKVAQS